MEGACERVDLFEAEEEGDLPWAQISLREEATRRSMADVVEELLVAGPEFPKAALERARAHSESLRDLLDGRAFAADLLAEGGSNVVGEGPRRAVPLEGRFESWHEERE